MASDRGPPLGRLRHRRCSHLACAHNGPGHLASWFFLTAVEVRPSERTGVVGPEEASSDEIIAGHRQLIARVHARGLKIYGATLTPFEGAFYFSPEGEVKRQAVNEWIRTSGAYDAVIDFDAATRDPTQPSRFQPGFSEDNLHPNDAGYKAMADAIDLTLFDLE